MSSMRPVLARHIKEKFGVKRWTANPHFIQKCSGCLKKLHEGEVVIHMQGSSKYHRQCVKDFVEWTYELVPASDDERRAVEGGLLEEIDTERARREFEAYRELLRARLQAGSSSQ